jgi:hypothetical protein
MQIVEATTANGAVYVSLDEALNGAQAPPLQSEFSVTLVGVLKPNARDPEDSEEDSFVRLYPPTGREDRYRLIKKADLDRDRIEVVSAQVAAARGWLAPKVMRVRVRAGAEVVSVQTRTTEAHRLADDEEQMVAQSGPCQGSGKPCLLGYTCIGGAICRRAGHPDASCPGCVA